MPTVDPGDAAPAAASERRVMIRIDGAGMIYQAESGPVDAMRDISLEIFEGEFVALVGPSGCGKSTLLRAIAGLRPLTSGRISVDGSLVDKPLPKVGMVFQAALLLKWRSVLDNVLLPVELSDQNTSRFRDRAVELLQLVGLGEFIHKRPAELSGGMQQRASLCRALIMDPPILLMDEPFGALDAMTRDEMNIELLRIWGESSSATHQRKTIVFVTHSIPEAAFLADRVVVMSARPGRVASIRTVPIARPRIAETRADPELGRLSFEIYTELAATTGKNESRAGPQW
ncbi:MAG: ABC transporter ATP-binding protein [Betaproteobacteria bacterium]